MIFFYNYAVIFMIMNLVWILCWLLRTPTIIDVGWPFIVTVCSLFYLYSHNINEVNILYSVIILIWGLRLGFFLFYTRLRKGIRDKRYLVLSIDWSRPWLFYLIMVHFQGILIFILSLSVYALASSNQYQLAWYDIIFASGAIFAVIYEAIADEELYRFGSVYPGELCDVGLWQYSRHPNYFFEWLFWSILSLIAFIKSGDPLSFSAPALLYVVMNYMTIPITESGSLRVRGDRYKEYQQRTSRFFLWFSKKQ